MHEFRKLARRGAKSKLTAIRRADGGRVDADGYMTRSERLKRLDDKRTEVEPDLDSKSRTSLVDEIQDRQKKEDARLRYADGGRIVPAKDNEVVSRTVRTAPKFRPRAGFDVTVSTDDAKRADARRMMEDAPRANGGKVSKRLDRPARKGSRP